MVDNIRFKTSLLNWYWIVNLKTDTYSIFMTFCQVFYKRSYQLLLSQATLHIGQYSKKKVYDTIFDQFLLHETKKCLYVFHGFP